MTSANILGTMIDAGKNLDVSNIPEEGRFFVVSPTEAALLKQSELRQAYLTGDSTSPLRNGFIGMVDRFKVYVSNNLYTAGSITYGIYGHPKALAYASQFTNTETVRLESSFGDGVRGLAVYGYKTVVPSAIGYVKML